LLEALLGHLNLGPEATNQVGQGEGFVLPARMYCLQKTSLQQSSALLQIDCMVAICII
jgi:hypothetical protein